MRNDQQTAVQSLLASALSDEAGPVGCEASTCGRQLSAALGEDVVDIEPDMLYLRRRKEVDELALLQVAIDANEAMFARAREIVEPGLDEIDLYSELQRVAVQYVGERLTYFGQDFRSAARGGPPRRRACAEGELWILDLGVGVRGYHSDHARTLAVGEPSENQQRAWHAAHAIHDWFQKSAKAGVSCKELHEKAQRQLDVLKPWRFNHHLGHGIGLFPHEAPHLNPRWADTLEEGDVIAVEPGLYHQDLNAGVRLEQNYRVTVEGVERLSGEDRPL